MESAEPHCSGVARAARSRVLKEAADGTVDELSEASEQEDTITLHFREIPKDAVHRDHVIAILGPAKAKQKHAIEVMTQRIQERKSHLRQWAYEHLKKQMLAIARELQLKIDKNRLVSSFSEVVQWWTNCDANDDQAAVSLNHVVYGWFTEHKKWERTLERHYMRQNKLVYSEESMATACQECKKSGCDPKGCVAKTITYVKADIVSRFQKAGKSSNHGMVLTKSRPAERVRDADGKYVKRKRGEFCLTTYNEDEEEEENEMTSARKKVLYMGSVHP